MAPVTRSKARALARATTLLASTVATRQRRDHESDSPRNGELELMNTKVTGKRNRREDKKKITLIESIETIPTIVPAEAIEQPIEVTKKIKLSEEEANLNGAPEGELYDVAVLSDEALTPLTLPEADFASAFDILSCHSSTWASRHNSIEILRRVCRFHSELFSAFTLKVTLSECCLEIESLRSCVSRNGISCLKALYKVHIPWTDDLSSVYERSIHLLLNKSSSGPKFLCALASETLEIGLQSIPLSALIPIFQPFNSHKNSEISSRSYSLVAQRLLSITTQTDLSDYELQVQYCQYLAQGLHSLRPQSRDLSKKALLKLFLLIGREGSLEIIEQSIPSERKIEMINLVEESQKKNTGPTKRLETGAGKENLKEKNRSLVRPAWKQGSNKSSSSTVAASSSLSSSSLLII
jgi:hypothetical protein